MDGIPADILSISRKGAQVCAATRETKEPDSKSAALWRGGSNSPGGHYLVRMNSSRSVLMVSASVVGIPWGKPL